jgi:hypothetical protein
VIVAELRVTVCPAVMLKESRLMSDADNPTVRVKMSVPPLDVRMRASAAVPVLSALVSERGNPDKVRTPPEAPAAIGLPSAIVANTEAIEVVPISSTAVAPAAVVTASKRAFLTAVVYVTAIFFSVDLC